MVCQVAAELEFFYEIYIYYYYYLSSSERIFGFISSFIANICSFTKLNTNIDNIITNILMSNNKKPFKLPSLIVQKCR